MKNIVQYNILVEPEDARVAYMSSNVLLSDTVYRFVLLLHRKPGESFIIPNH